MPNHYPVIYLNGKEYEKQHAYTRITEGFPGGSDGEESTFNAEDPVLILGLGRSPGEGNGYSLQNSCLENPLWTEEPGGLQSTGSQRIRHN